MDSVDWLSVSAGVILGTPVFVFVWELFTRPMLLNETPAWLKALRKRRRQKDQHCEKCGVRFPMPQQLLYYCGPCIEGSDGEQAALDRLEGLRCAKCGSDAPFRVGITGIVFNSNCWDDETDIKCVACGHTGVVADFRNKEGS